MGNLAFEILKKTLILSSFDRLGCRIMYYNFLIFVCKNRANSSTWAYIAWDVKDIKRLHQSEEEKIILKHTNKLCDCGVNYTKTLHYVHNLVKCFKWLLAFCGITN